MQQHIKIGPNGVVQKSKPSVAHFINLAFIFRKITSFTANCGIIY